MDRTLPQDITNLQAFNTEERYTKTHISGTRLVNNSLFTDLKEMLWCQSIPTLKMVLPVGSWVKRQVKLIDNTFFVKECKYLKIITVMKLNYNYIQLNSPYQ